MVLLGDPFGTRSDYAKGILYSSRRQYLCDADSPDLGPGWQDGDHVRAPRNMMSKRQLRRDLMRKQRESHAPQPLRHLQFLERLQELSQRYALMRSMMEYRAKESSLPSIQRKKPLSPKVLVEKMMSDKKATTTSLPAVAGASGADAGKGDAAGSSSSSSSSSGGGGGGGSRTLGGATSKTRTSVIRSEEQRAREMSAWEHVTDHGHPYWLNQLTGAMQFESPFQTEEKEEVLPDIPEGEGTFDFLLEWRYYPAPNFVKQEREKGTA